MDEVGHGRRHRVVVGVDGSNDANLALAWAAEEATLRHADVYVVHAWTLPVPDVPGGGAPAGWVDEVQAERHASELLDATVEGVLGGLDNQPAVVERVLVEGGAAAALVNVAAGADLLVVGARGRGGFGGLLLGSVGQQLALHAPCPLVIVRAQDDRHDRP
jgi:nucleotide-binding universal stress UspA family protein